MKPFKLEKYIMPWKYVVAFILTTYTVIMLMTLWEIINPNFFGLGLCLFSIYVSMTLIVNGIVKSFLFSSVIIGINAIILTWRNINCNFNAPQILSLIVFGVLIGFVITSVFVKLEKIAEKEN